eukprot:Rhum_TRINITY_DN14618_c33_g1::Rhum_TRINITY_DN14618_c33_g1_i1::g.106141::m.106141
MLSPPTMATLCSGNENSDEPRVIKSSGLPHSDESRLLSSSRVDELSSDDDSDSDSRKKPEKSCTVTTSCFIDDAEPSLLHRLPPPKIGHHPSSSSSSSHPCSDPHATAALLSSASSSCSGGHATKCSLRNDVTTGDSPASSHDDAAALGTDPLDPEESPLKCAANLLKLSSSSSSATAAAAAAAATAVVVNGVDGSVRSVELTAQGFGREAFGKHRRRRTPRPRVPSLECLRTCVRDGGGAAAAATAAAAADRRSARSRRKRHGVHALKGVPERLLLLRRGARVVVLGRRVEGGRQLRGERGCQVVVAGRRHAGGGGAAVGGSGCGCGCLGGGRGCGCFGGCCVAGALLLQGSDGGGDGLDGTKTLDVEGLTLQLLLRQREQHHAVDVLALEHLHVVFGEVHGPQVLCHLGRTPRVRVGVDLHCCGALCCFSFVKLRETTGHKKVDENREGGGE